MCSSQQHSTGLSRGRCRRGWTHVASIHPSIHPSTPPSAPLAHRQSLSMLVTEATTTLNVTHALSKPVRMASAASQRFNSDMFLDMSTTQMRLSETTVYTCVIRVRQRPSRVCVVYACACMRACCVCVCACGLASSLLLPDQARTWKRLTPHPQFCRCAQCQKSNSVGSCQTWHTFDATCRDLWHNGADVVGPGSVQARLPIQPRLLRFFSSPGVEEEPIDFTRRPFPSLH